jgi:tRNA (guanine-N(7)-)-methyltransferase subunit TRM82
MAAHFQYPIQCIQYLEGPRPSAQRVFIASAGPRIYSWSADDGCRLSVWPLDSEIDNIGESSSVAEETHSNSGADEPPEKKRKLSLSEQASRDIERRKPGKSCAAWSSIPILVASPTQRYVVAVTGEDKCLRVFSVSEDGGLIQISER